MHPTQKTFRILIVDDNEAAASSLGELLTYTGHTVELAYDGASALSKAVPFVPEIVVLDIGLPDMEGYEVASKLRMHDAPYTLIALTGYGQDEDKEKARKAGFDFHLTKPVGLADLQAVFSQLGNRS